MIHGVGAGALSVKIDKHGWLRQVFVRTNLDHGRSKPRWTCFAIENKPVVFDEEVSWKKASKASTDNT